MQVEREEGERAKCRREEGGKMRIGGEGRRGVGRVDNAGGGNENNKKVRETRSEAGTKAGDVLDFTCRARTIASRNTTETSVKTVTDYPPESTGALDPLQHATITSRPRWRPDHDPPAGWKPLPVSKVKWAKMFSQERDKMAALKKKKKKKKMDPDGVVTSNPIWRGTRFPTWGVCGDAGQVWIRP